MCQKFLTMINVRVHIQLLLVMTTFTVTGEHQCKVIFLMKVKMLSNQECRVSCHRDSRLMDQQGCAWCTCLEYTSACLHLQLFLYTDSWVVTSGVTITQSSNLLNMISLWCIISSLYIVLSSVLMLQAYAIILLLLLLTSGSAIAEGPRDALVSRNPATTKHLTWKPYRVALFAWFYV